MRLKKKPIQAFCFSLSSSSSLEIQVMVGFIVVIVVAAATRCSFVLGEETLMKQAKFLRQSEVKCFVSREVLQKLDDIFIG